MDFKPGDQIKVRVSLDAQKQEQWPADERFVREWAAQRGIRVAATEAVLVHGAAVPAAFDVRGATPESLLRMFAEREELDDALVQEGVAILTETLAA